MSPKKEIQILSEILNLLNRHNYVDEDNYAVKLSRILSDNPTQSSFIKDSNKIKTSFFRRNNLQKEKFLIVAYKRFLGLNLPDNNSTFHKELNEKNQNAIIELAAQNITIIDNNIKKENKIQDLVVELIKIKGEHENQITKIEDEARFKILDLLETNKILLQTNDKYEIDIKQLEKEIVELRRLLKSENRGAEDIFG